MTPMFVALCFLGVQSACCSLQIDYQSVQMWVDPEEDRRYMQEKLRIVFTSSDDLNQIANDRGLTCRIEFPDCPELSGIGYLRRDLTDPAWAADFPYSGRDRPVALRYQADLTLSLRTVGSSLRNAREALAGGKHGAAHFIVYAPSKPFVVCASNSATVPAQDIAAAVPQ